MKLVKIVTLVDAGGFSSTKAYKKILKHIYFNLPASLPLRPFG